MAMSKKILLVTLSLSFLVKQTTLAFGSRSHERLTEIAFTQEIENLQRVGWLSDKTYKLADCIQDIVHSSVGPDRDESGGIGGFYSGHFYNPYYDKNEDNAMRRMKKHFEISIDYLNRNMKRDAIKELGRSLHYLQDMCCPVHIWGYNFNGNGKSVSGVFNVVGGKLMMHKKLETDWDNMWERENFIFEYLRESSFVLKRVPSLDVCSAANIGDETFKLAWEQYGDWVRECHKTDKNILMIVNKINPFYWIESNGISIIGTIFSGKNSAINNGWEDVFLLPCVASHTLVKLFVHKVTEREEARKRKEEEVRKRIKENDKCFIQ